nr:hypothetical protein CFP56_40873 [Quercus suber]
MVELALSPISPSDLTRDQDLLVGGPGCLPQLRSSCCFWGWLCHLQLQRVTHRHSPSLQNHRFKAPPPLCANTNTSPTRVSNHLRYGRESSDFR